MDSDSPGASPTPPCENSDSGTNSDEDVLYYSSDGCHSLHTSSDEEFIEPPVSVEERLREVKAKTNCTLETIRQFAKVLNEFGVTCAKDPKTILKTDTNIDMSDSFIHLGLTKGILSNLSVNDINLDKIVLRFYVDGIPLYNSSHLQFWPILCQILGSSFQHVFAVSVFCGTSKPPSLRNFLGPTVRELKALHQEGLLFNGKHFETVLIDSFICDAPARSFLKVIKGHTGYHGCERCMTKGERLLHRTIYPCLDAKLRDNANFRDGSDDLHHKGVSPLEELPANVFDMVFGFPLDPLHLRDLGIIKKLIKEIWRGPVPRRPSPNSKHFLSDDKISKMSEAIIFCSKHLPKIEFNTRRGQSLIFLSKWKAREYRLFLLYTGIYVLRKILPTDQYDHFVKFHIAMRLLSDPSSSRDQMKYAGDILHAFVDDFGRIYGEHNLCYNVHSLIHFAQDCLIYGHADSFSAYVGESALGKMKGFLRTSRKPLAQWARRASELEHVRKVGEKRPPPANKYGADYPSLNSLIPNSDNDSYYLINNTQTIVKICKITNEHVFGSQLRLFKDSNTSSLLAEVYDKPNVKIPSSHLNIFLTDGLNRIKKWSKSSFIDSVKCVHLPDYLKDVSLLIPILHLNV